MAGIRKKGDAYYCTFRFQGRRYYFAVGNVPEAQALAKGAEVDETLGLLERGRLAVPEGVALEDFVAAGGKVPPVSARPETVTARQLFDRYLATLANGTIEENSLGTIRTHLNQPDERAELQAELVALGWAWFVRPVRLGNLSDALSVPGARSSTVRCRKISPRCDIGSQVGLTNPSYIVSTYNCARFGFIESTQLA
jgi:hypothetical protein